MGGVVASPNRPGSRSYKTIVDQYGKRCQWLRNEKFLKDLEGDSVDTEILDEELRVLQEEEPRTCRGKTAKLLETSPIQIAMCVLILIDAGIVVTEILLDLHAMRSQQQEATIALNQTIDFLSIHFANDLSDYQGNDFQTILGKLRQKYGSNHGENAELAAVLNANSARDPTATGGGGDRSIPTSRSFFQSPSRLESGSRRGERSTQNAKDSRRKRKRNTFDVESDDKRSSSEPRDRLRTVNDVNSNRERFEENALKSFRYSIDRKTDAKNSISDLENRFLNSQNSFDISRPRRRRKPDSKESEMRVKALRRSVDALERDEDETVVLGDVTLPSRSSANPIIPGDSSAMDRPPGGNCYRGHLTPVILSGNKHAEKLLKIAHTLHYASIAILGVFVLQVFLKLFGMGMEFFKSRLEVFDGIIIIASFTLDLVFVEGVSGEQGEEAIALLIIFLLWRILRVVNGIMVTSKQRQEFRIKLQRRACRRAEKKMESLEEDLSWKDKEIHCLKVLCLRNGVNEEDIEAAQPKRKPVFNKMNTSSGLSSIASLSLGFTMSMRPPPNSAPPGFPTSSSSASSASAPASAGAPSSTSPPSTPLHRQHPLHSAVASSSPPQKCENLRPRSSSSKTPSFQMQRISEERKRQSPPPPPSSISKSPNGIAPNDAAPSVVDGTPETTGRVRPLENSGLPSKNDEKSLEWNAEVEKTETPNSSEANDPRHSTGYDGKIGHMTTTTTTTTTTTPSVGPLCTDLASEASQTEEPSSSKETAAAAAATHPQTQPSAKGGSGHAGVSQQPKQTSFRRSQEGSVRWFRWRSLGSNSKANESNGGRTGGGGGQEAGLCAASASAAVAPGIRVNEMSADSGASSKRSVWKNAFRHRRNDTTDV